MSRQAEPVPLPCLGPLASPGKRSSEVAPSSGPIGQRVVVKGRGFDASPSGNKLTIGGDAALVFSASPTELRAADKALHESEPTP